MYLHGYSGRVIALSRFRVPATDAAAFRARAEAAVAFYRDRPGCLAAAHAQNLDEPDLWVIATTWENVGSYRRAFNGYDAKVVLVPLLSESIDEPGAYDAPERVGENIPRSR